MQLFWVNPRRGKPRKAKAFRRNSSDDRSPVRTGKKNYRLSAAKAAKIKLRELRVKAARSAGLFSRKKKNPVVFRRKKPPLYGAAAIAYRKKHPKKKRGTMARRKRKRNPRRRTTFARRMGGFRLNPRRRRVRRRRNPGGLGGGSITPSMIEARAARMAAARYAKRKRKGGKSLVRAAKAFRKRYAKAVTRARRKRARKMGISRAKARAVVRALGGKTRKKKGTSMARKKSGRKSAKRVAAGKKAARTRARNKAARRGRKGAKRSRVSRKRVSRRRRRMPYSRYLLRARRAIKRGRSRKYGSKRSRRTIRHFHMRTNPGRIMAVVKGALKAALPVVAGYVATKFVINKFGARIPMLDRLGRHQGPALALLGVVGAHFATRKGPLAKYSSGLLVGAGFNLVTTLISEYAPASVKGMLGLGDSGVYDEALADYVETGDYIETGDYVEVGAEQELAGMQELAGGSNMLAPIPSQRMLAPIPSRPTVAPVPDWSVDWATEGLYKGVFSKKMF